MRELSLFSGYGGFSLGLKLASIDVVTIGYVELDVYCQRILTQRMEDGFLDKAPIIRDIRTADFRPMAGLVDIVTAGFPCQPHSKAGKRLGKEDSRNLWPDTLRVIWEVEPSYVLLENVQGLADGANPYAAEIIGQLSEVVGGQLNPEWVEWLMGLPIGWTDLKPLETVSFQQWSQGF